MVAPSEHPTLADWAWIGSTALSLAAQKGARPVVEMLLAHEGTNLDLATKYGRTPVSSAALQGHHEAVRVLADKGANLDRADVCGRTVMYLAAQKDHREVVRVLADKGANLDLANKNGATPV